MGTQVEAFAIEDGWTAARILEEEPMRRESIPPATTRSKRYTNRPRRTVRAWPRHAEDGSQAAAAVAHRSPHRPRKAVTSLTARSGLLLKHCRACTS